MTYNKGQMTKNDQKIIEKNPSIAPYDLLTSHGLSQGGYNELLATNDKKEAEKIAVKPSNLLVPDKIVESARHRAMPQTTTLNSPTRGVDHETVMVRNKDTGKEFKLSRFAAERWIKKKGMAYEIV